MCPHYYSISLGNMSHVIKLVILFLYHFVEASQMGRSQITKLIITKYKKKIQASCLDVSQLLMNKIGINSNIIVGTH